jgi:hypothetical protein
MTNKLLIILSSRDKEKILSGLMYAYGILKFNWLDDVEIFFFGPSEKLLAEDEEVSGLAKQITNQKKITACKFIADNEGITDRLLKIGINVEFVGSIISALIREGYQPMVW